MADGAWPDGAWCRDCRTKGHRLGRRPDQLKASHPLWSTAWLIRPGGASTWWTGRALLSAPLEERANSLPSVTSVMTTILLCFRLVTLGGTRPGRRTVGVRCKPMYRAATGVAIHRAGPLLCVGRTTEPRRRPTRTPSRPQRHDQIDVGAVQPSGRCSPRTRGSSPECSRLARSL